MRSERKDRKDGKDTKDGKDEKLRDGKGLSRRQLLGGSAALAGAAAVGVAGAGIAGITACAAPAHSPMQHRALGSTGLQVSEIGFGGYPVDEPETVRYAFDRGITYFDTAHCYRGGRSEEVIGASPPATSRSCSAATASSTTPTRSNELPKPTGAAWEWSR